MTLALSISLYLSLSHSALTCHTRAGLARNPEGDTEQRPGRDRDRGENTARRYDGKTQGDGGLSARADRVAAASQPGRIIVGAVSSSAVRRFVRRYFRRLTSRRPKAVTERTPRGGPACDATNDSEVFMNCVHELCS